MNRSTLSKATNTDEGPIPSYFIEEICGGTHESEPDAIKTAEYLIRRLQKSNLNTKLKSLILISVCVRDGNPAFADTISDAIDEIQKFMHLSGPPDPVNGDAKYRQIRGTANEIMSVIDSGGQSQPPPPSQYGAPAPGYHGNTGNGYSGNDGHGYPPPPPQQQGGGYNQPGPGHVGGGGYNGPGNYNAPNGYNERGGYGPPATGAGYGGPPAGYGGPPNAGGGYGPPNGTAGGYGISNPGGYGGAGPSSEYNGAQGGWGNTGGGGAPGGWGSNSASGGPGPGEWGNPSNANPTGADGGAPGGGSSRMGVWGSSGYQATAPQQQQPNYGRPRNERDNRPTVLVGTQPKKSWKERMGSKFSQNKAPAATFSNRGPVGAAATSGGGLNAQRQPSGRLGNLSQKMHTLSKGAREKWERRGVDKSITSSLANNDGCASTISMDSMAYQPRQATGGGDESGDYERGLVDNICAPGGLSRTPPPDALHRFVELAQTLDPDVVGTILDEKLGSNSWQSRFKALCVIDALLQAPGCSHYGEWFEENCEGLEELENDGKSSVRNKALDLLKMLGLRDESAAAARPVSAAPSRRPAPQNDLIDMMGFDGLSVSDATHNGTSAPKDGVPPTLDVFGDNGNTASPAGDGRARCLSDFGKDLFTQANSPGPQSGSAFNFM